MKGKWFDQQRTTNDLKKEIATPLNTTNKWPLNKHMEEGLLQLWLVKVIN